MAEQGEGVMAQWLVEFENEFARHYDTPNEFLSGIGLMAAGAALANRVYLRSPNEITTNLYLLLCSPAGWFHKSSPTNKAVEMIKKFIPETEFMPSNPSSESFAKCAKQVTNGSKIGHGVLVYDELRDFLSQSRKQHAENFASLVSQRFEKGPDIRYSRMKEKDVEIDLVPGGFILSFVAGTTNALLLENLSRTDIEGGILSRCLLIEAHEKTRSEANPIPFDDDVLDYFASELMSTRNSYDRTEFKFDRESDEILTQLYHEIERDAVAHGHPEYPSLVSRAPTYLKKISLIHAALEQRGDYLITQDDIEMAAEIVLKSVKSCEMIVDEAAAGNDVYGRNLFRVRKILSKREKFPKRDLMRLMHIRVRELDDILDSLTEQGHVRIEKEGKAEIVFWIE